MQSHYGAGRQHDLADLMDEIDMHLAWQADSSEHRLEHQASTGTLIVDWDGSGTPIISYSEPQVATIARPVEVEMEPRRRASSQAKRIARERSSFQPRAQPQVLARYADDEVLSPTQCQWKGKQRAGSAQASASAQDATFSARPRPLRISQDHKSSITSPHNVAPPSLHSRPLLAERVEHHVPRGYDRTAQFAYDYSGHVTPRRHHAAPAKQYVAPPARAATHHPPGKHKTIVSFVKRLLGKLGMGKARQQRAEAMRSRTWVERGYVT